MIRLSRLAVGDRVVVVWFGGGREEAEITALARGGLVRVLLQSGSERWVPSHRVHRIVAEGMREET